MNTMVRKLRLGRLKYVMGLLVLLAGFGNDGEICSLDRRGRPQFKNLMFHRGNPPCFFAFDLLTYGKDLRTERLLDRKQELRRLLARACLTLKYTEYNDGCVMA